MQSKGAYPVNGNWSLLFARYNGAGDLDHASGNNVIVQSFTYTFHAGSADGVSANVIPNSNNKVNCVESSKGRYDQEIQHDVDFAFEFKSIRLYIARAKSTMDIPKQVKLTMKDFIVCNKQLSPSLDFTLPSST